MYINNDLTVRFESICHAYEILQDEQKRKIYDRYGEQGISFSENANLSENELELILSILDPRFSIYIFLCLVVLFGIFFSIPVFILLKLEKMTLIASLPWPAVFAPLWALDLLILIFLLLFIPRYILALIGEPKDSDFAPSDLSFDPSSPPPTPKLHNLRSTPLSSSLSSTTTSSSSSSSSSSFPSSSLTSTILLADQSTFTPSDSVRSSISSSLDSSSSSSSSTTSSSDSNPSVRSSFSTSIPTSENSNLLQPDKTERFRKTLNASFRG